MKNDFKSLGSVNEAWCVLYSKESLAFPEIPGNNVLLPFNDREMESLGIHAVNVYKERHINRRLAYMEAPSENSLVTRQEDSLCVKMPTYSVHRKRFSVGAAKAFIGSSFFASFYRMKCPQRRVYQNSDWNIILLLRAQISIFSNSNENIIILWHHSGKSACVVSQKNNRPLLSECLITLHDGISYL